MNELNKGGGAVEAALAVLRIKQKRGGLIMTKPAERSAARLAAVQALYQMDVSGKSVIDALAEFEAFWIGREVEGIEFKPSDNDLLPRHPVGRGREPARDRREDRQGARRPAGR